MDLQIRRELDMISKTIADTVSVNTIYLFGSYAYGRPHRDSDFDLYVIIPDDSMRPLEAMQTIGHALYHVKKRPADILVGTQSNFEQRKTLPTIERTIFRNGVILYGDQQPVQAMA